METDPLQEVFQAEVLATMRAFDECEFCLVDIAFGSRIKIELDLLHHSHRWSGRELLFEEVRISIVPSIPYHIAILRRRHLIVNERLNIDDALAVGNLIDEPLIERSLCQSLHELLVLTIEVDVQ